MDNIFQKFFRSNWFTLFVVLYIILPDFFPGPIDDILLFIFEMYRQTYLLKERVQGNFSSSNNKNKSNRSQKIDKVEAEIIED